MSASDVTNSIKGIKGSARVRIYTEHKENLGELTGLFFMGFTIFQGTGYYKGVREVAAVIEIIIDTKDDKEPIYAADVMRVFGLANLIATRNHQKEVIVTTEAVPYSYSVFGV